MDKKRYPSTKFVALTNNESIPRSKTTYFIWIISVTVLFFMSAAFLSYKRILPILFRNGNSPSSVNNGDFIGTKQSDNYSLKLYNPDSLLERLKKQANYEKSEFSCNESKEKLNVIPFEYVRQFKNPFHNICDYINLDLLLYYDHIINKYEAKILKLIFNDYQLNLSFAKNPDDFASFLTSLKSIKFQFYAVYLKRENYSLELKHFASYRALTEELNHWYNYLNLLQRFLSSYEQQKLKKYLTNCSESNFEKYTEETQKRLFHFEYSFKMTEKKLQEINSVIIKWSETLKIKIHNATVIFYGKVVILSDIRNKILNLNVTSLESIFIFASYTIYLDEDMTLPGVNLAIVAPEWVFLKKIKINLSGTAGEEHKNENAVSKQPGKPGNPGRSAGNFLGIGNPHEKFLFVFADGGKGAKGQNGAKGADGVNNTHPDPPVNSPACMAKVNIFNNSYGQTITHYKVYNKAGCGGSGTDGGVGGVGGAGGAITLITKNSVKTIKGSPGSAGLPGKGGTGGVGGQNGCFYEVFDVDEEILHRVTTVKCLPDNVLPGGLSGRDNHNTHKQIFPAVKKNLTVANSLMSFIRFAGTDLLKYNDANVVSFLKEIKNIYMSNEINLEYLITEYKIIRQLDTIEFYELYQEKISKYIEFTVNESLPFLKYLKSIVSGRILLKKSNVNFFFIDIQHFLNILKGSIKSANNLTIAPVSYLNRKIEIKCEQIKVNLKVIRTKLNVWNSELERNIVYFNARKNVENLNKILRKKRISCVMISAIDITNKIIDWFLEISNSNGTQVLDDGNTWELTNENCFGMSANIFNELFLKKVNLLNKKEVEKYLQDLKDFFNVLKESDTLLLKEENNLLEALIDQLEHFIALYRFIEWKEVENLFSETLSDLATRTSVDSKEEKEEDEEKIKFLKSEVKNVLHSVFYKLGVEALQQNFPSLISRNPRLDVLKKESDIRDFFAGVSFLQPVNGPETFCKNQLKAVFDRDSAVGEFYFWHNFEIRDELKKLFSGEEINIKSNIINRHVFDKNFIQFTTLKLEFQCVVGRSSCEEHLQDILLDFKMDVTHSGYSYYNWGGEVHIIISEKVNLEYSFRMQNSKEPEVYNSLFKKCQDGKIKLSPFTIWTIRLLPLNNRAQLTKLSPFVNSVNLRLTGTGTYII